MYWFIEKTKDRVEETRLADFEARVAAARAIEILREATGAGRRLTSAEIKEIISVPAAQGWMQDANRGRVVQSWDNGVNFQTRLAAALKELQRSKGSHEALRALPDISGVAGFADRSSWPDSVWWQCVSRAARLGAGLWSTRIEVGNQLMMHQHVWGCHTSGMVLHHAYEDLAYGQIGRPLRDEWTAREGVAGLKV